MHLKHWKIWILPALLLGLWINAAWGTGGNLSSDCTTALSSPCSGGGLAPSPCSSRSGRKLTAVSGFPVLPCCFREGCFSDVMPRISGPSVQTFVVFLAPALVDSDASQGNTASPVDDGAPPPGSRVPIYTLVQSFLC